MQEWVKSRTFLWRDGLFEDVTRGAQQFMAPHVGWLRDCKWYEKSGV